MVESVNNPEQVDSGRSEVNPSQDTSFFGLDVVQEEDQGVEQVVSALIKEMSSLIFNTTFTTRFPSI